MFTFGLVTALLVKMNYKPKILVRFRKRSHDFEIKNLFFTQDYKAFRIGGWLVISALIYFVYSHPTSIEQNGMRMSRLTELFYPIIDKLSLSLLYAWAILNCSHGYARNYFFVLFVDGVSYGHQI